MLKKNIPTILLVGMFFFSFSGHCLADHLGLAEDLYSKGEWALCRRECLRALLDQAVPTERFQLLNAMASTRSGRAAVDIVPELASLIDENRDPQVTAMAAYELGRLQWQLNQPQKAFQSFATAFHSTTNKDLFLHAACSLFLLMKDYPELKAGQEDLVSQINTSRTLWYGALFSQCGKPEPANRPANAPGWFIELYRAQISPAIGDRCVLQPSCSEYFRQAKQKHGFLAYPMIADRFFREPEASNWKQDPVIMEDGQIRYRDPVENHDFWMKP